MGMGDMQGRAQIAVEGLHLREANGSSRGASRACGKLCAMNASIAGVSVRTPRGVASAGTRAFGFTARYAGDCCSVLPKSIRLSSYVAPASLRAMRGQRTGVACVVEGEHVLGHGEVANRYSLGSRNRPPQGLRSGQDK